MKPATKLDDMGVESDSQLQDQDIPDFRFIRVTLTFDGYIPFKFEFKRQQSNEVKESKQAFYALTDDEQKANLKSYRVNILSSLLTKRPSNVQGWREIGDDQHAAEFIAFFDDPDNDELLQWVWSQYQEKLYPKELLSSPSD
jgi:hypothetical protein